MRLTILSGGALAVAAALTVWLGAFFGLELDHVALLGVALGAVAGLVPHGRAVHRIAGFGAGFAIAWVAYLLRAAMLPDSTSGRAVAVLGVVLACVLVSIVARHRLPLWSTLVGVAALLGAYEEAYTAAPSQVVDTSMTSATAVLLAAAVGFAVSALFTAEPPTARTSRPSASAQETTPMDELMTESAR
jgi:hypothetical protein